MRERRLYVDQPLNAGSVVQLPDSTARHVHQVLRLKPNDEVVLFDGRGGEYVAILDEVRRAKVSAHIESHAAIERESRLSIHVGHGISRGERMDFTVQKAVELGVAAFSALTTERSVVKLEGERLQRRRRHWQSVANHACEQSGRNRIVAIDADRTLTDWLENASNGLRFTLAPTAQTRLSDFEWEGEPISVLIGPEGGLSEREIAQAFAAGFQPLQLGPRVLRTETAALAMLSALQTRWGDFA